MCGINGIISINNIDNLEFRINKMNESIVHRGPDAGNYTIYNDSRLALGHRRLSILDLDERSNQPLVSNDNKSVIVFNGEIYNYRELRKKLNYSFKTESDTEVLLAGIKLNGIDFIKQCNGMFGFAYYDVDSGDIYLARDRFGIKPLYYYKDDNKLVFSSEIKGILNSGLIDARFNYDAVDEYLGNRYVREPITFFKDIYQLPSGYYMKISKNLDIEVVRYWALPEQFNVNESYDEDSIYNLFKKQLNESIKKRMVADVTVGTYLSGGIDSSLISAITSINSDKQVNTYTIGFPELNEFEYARLVADKYDTNHHEIIINEDNYFKLMSEIIKYKDAPLGVPNEIPLAQMSKELKKDITVVLSGEGADELLGGYGKIFRSPFDYSNVDKNIKEDFYQYFINKYEYVPRDIRDKYLSCGKILRNEFDAAVKESFNKHSNEENVFRFFHTYHIKGLLQRVDITTMYASVEARVPFLDHELVEFVYRDVPYNLKLKWISKEDKSKAKSLHSSEYSEVLDQPKCLLRKYALELLPEEVVTRKKMGFPVPLNKWFGDLKQLAKDILKDADWLNSLAINELCDTLVDSPRGVNSCGCLLI